MLLIGVVATSLVACSEDSFTNPQEVGHTSGPATSAAATQGALLAEIRAVTAQYHRVEAAVAAGYVAVTACLPDEGIRYRKAALIDAVVDPTQPELLLYEVLPNGKLHRWPLRRSRRNGQPDAECPARGRRRAGFRRSVRRRLQCP